jgi:hypothetical protein
MKLPSSICHQFLAGVEFSDIRHKNNQAGEVDMPGYSTRLLRSGRYGNGILNARTMKTAISARVTLFAGQYIKGVG